MTNKDLFLKDITNNEQIVIVCDFEYEKLLIKWKTQKYPHSNIKFISYQKAISMLSFEITSDMIAELLKNGFGYTKAKKVLNILRLLDEERINKANQVIKNAYLIIKPLINKNLFDQSIIFNNKHIYLFNREEDIELTALFISKGFKLNKINIEDINLNNTFNFITQNEVVQFDNKYEQYMFVFADIKKYLSSHQEDNRNIRLVVKNEYDLFYVKQFSQLFNIPVYANMEMNLINQPGVNNAMKMFKSNHKIDIKKIESADQSVIALVKLIKQYKIEELDFEKGYLNLVEILNSTRTLDLEVEDIGIIVTNRFVFDDELINYVLVFQDDVFYKSFNDNDIITDVEKKNLSINPSYIKTLIDKRLKTAFILNNNITLLSRVKQHLDDHIYDSGLIKPLNLKQRNFSLTDEKNVNELLDKSFTSFSANTLASMLQERNYDTSKFEEVGFYDNGTNELKIPPKDHYSISDIQEYSKCPFKYLLDRVYHLSSDDDKYYANLGTLIHSVLEHIMDGQFDFDGLYDKGIEQFKINMARDGHGDYDHKFDFFVLIVKPWFKKICEIYRARLFELASKGIKIIPEVEFNFTIPETDYKFKGVADAVVITQNNGKKYYSIFDYKTGSDVFEPFAVCCGQNIQLPLYFFGLRHSDKKDLIKDCEKGGFGLKKALASSLTKFKNDKSCISDKSINKFIEVDLYGNNDQDYEGSISLYSTTKAGKPTKTGVDQLVSFHKMVKNIGNGVKVQFDVDFLAKQAQEIAIEKIDYLTRSIYPITITANAKSIVKNHWDLEKKDTNCQYCKYQDICYLSSPKTIYIDQKEKVEKAWEELLIKQAANASNNEGEDNE